MDRNLSERRVVACYEHESRNGSSDGDDERQLTTLRDFENKPGNRHVKWTSDRNLRRRTWRMRSGTPREIEEMRRGGRLALAVAGSVDLSQTGGNGSRWTATERRGY